MTSHLAEAVHPSGEGPTHRGGPSHWVGRLGDIHITFAELTSPTTAPNPSGSKPCTMSKLTITGNSSAAHRHSGARPVHGISCSIAAETSKALVSSKGWAMTWMPVGMPQSAMPEGTPTIGTRLQMLNGIVMCACQ